MSKMQWFNSSQSSAQAPPRAVVLISHGLNLHPDRLQPLVEVLQMGKADVLRLSLTGHESGQMEAFRAVTREQWLTDAHQAYLEAREHADRLQVPLFFLGYSLSAVLLQDLMNSVPPQTPIRIDRQVLLSPALELRPSLRKVGALLPFFPVLSGRWILPSLSYSNYHAQRGTPVSAYRALFESVNQVRETRLTRSKIPTLVIIDPQDELVSYKRTQALIEQFDLESWKVFPIQARGDLPIQYHHLIVDPHSVGKPEWSRMIAAIQSHFSADLSAKVQ